jgi:predicted protein tyrosine phosphatase
VYIRALNQELLIVSQEEALLFHGPGEAHWSVLSICDRIVVQRPEFPHARRLSHFFFDDVEGEEEFEGHFGARPDDVQAALAFAREIGNEPLMIHCHAGISRSTAIAWLVAFEKLKSKRNAVRKAFEIVRELRPMLRPNRRVLKLGVGLLVDEEEREQVWTQFRECLEEIGLGEWS